MKIIIYVRSADAPEQVDERLTILRNTSAARGWTVGGVHIDRVIGCQKARNRLPGHAAMLAAVARNEVDAVMVWSVHHLGTSVDSLLDTLAQLHQHGVKLIVHDRDNDAETVEHGGLLASAGMLIDARRAYRREAIIAGQLKAKAVGVRFGRPPLAPARIERVRWALAAGKGVREAGRIAGVSTAKTSRIKAEMISAGVMG
jgi:DNA invertase Pin-like site-specific DNA recombinase